MGDADLTLQTIIPDHPAYPARVVRTTHPPTPQPIPQHPRPGPVIQRHHQRLQIPLLP